MLLTSSAPAGYQQERRIDHYLNELHPWAFLKLSCDTRRVQCFVTFSPISHFHPHSTPSSFARFSRVRYLCQIAASWSNIREKLLNVLWPPPTGTTHPMVRVLEEAVAVTQSQLLDRKTRHWKKWVLSLIDSQKERQNTSSLSFGIASQLEARILAITDNSSFLHLPTDIFSNGHMVFKSSLEQ